MSENRELFNIEIEKMLLGCLISNPMHLDKLLAINFSPEIFYDNLHKKIYESIIILQDRGFNCDVTLLSELLKKDELFNYYGSDNYLKDLLLNSALIPNPYSYALTLQDLSIKRNLVTVTQDIISQVYNSNLEHKGTQYLEYAENAIYQLASSGMVERGFYALDEIVDSALTTIDKARLSSGITGVTSGLMDIDNILCGFQRSDLIIIAARPSMGKTAFAINLALNAAKSLENSQGSVGFFSLEMSAEQIATRILSIESMLDSHSLKSGLKQEGYNILSKVASNIKHLNLFIDDTPAISIATLRSRARKLKRQNNLAILFIDYLQLLRGAKNYDNRVLEISEITQGLKALAKELNIPVVALAQLSRAVEQREDKRPLLSDLRESGSIEQDADIVMFIYRAFYYMQRNKEMSEAEKDQIRNLAEIIIAKNRNGSTSTVDLFYNPAYSKFQNLNKHHLEA
ncbi:Replicative DNA helicase [Rickettsiales endosymbiont of Paramecium tredecaurelia]|uniref:replicative DNA helicase n=1 Tax=Candidatus Sarmatiella mevalonica TaxID=2770581 RepID=UPI001920CE76|nr:Replicative DNA helicase [Candidatus Sarmatiella mevalonica]